MSLHVLILGGTAEARELAAALYGRPDVEVTSSLAGRVARPRLPVGDLRTGGFGGAEGLARWIAERGVGAIVDATHPFAERISASAARAAQLTGVPLVALRRPGWSPDAGDDWHWVGSQTEAAALLPALGRRVFLTTGRQGLGAFADVRGVWFLIRCVDPPAGPMPAERHVLLDRGPYRLEGELELFRHHRLDVLVTKDSGGTHTAAKLSAARVVGAPVVVVRRPPRPDTECVASVAELLPRLGLPQTG